MSERTTLAVLAPLSGKKDFDRVFSNCQHRASSDNFAVLYCANDLGRPRLGAILARKKISSAVLRNSIKRQAREYLRLHPLAGDYLIIARKKTDQHEKKKLPQKYAHF